MFAPLQVAGRRVEMEHERVVAGRGRSASGGAGSRLQTGRHASCWEAVLGVPVQHPSSFDDFGVFW